MTSRRSAGFTLIELMIAMALTAFVAAMVYGLFVAEQRAMLQQSDVVDMTDNSRVALELISRDIRSAGFLIPSSTALMIEDNCGDAGNKLDFNPSATAPSNFGQPRSGATSMSGGDVLGVATVQLNTATALPSQESCPNGSDRITIFGQKAAIVPTTCNGGGCMANNTPLGTTIDVPCKDASPTSAGNCDATLAMLSPDVPLTCAMGTKQPFTTMGCLQGDPSKCVMLPVNSSWSCPASCPITGGLGNMPCVRLPMDSSFPSTNPWGPIGGTGNGDSLVVGGYYARSYQLLDLDWDGATELVYSDHLYEGLLNPSATVDPHWTIVAENIDDLQFAYIQNPVSATANLVGGWDGRSLYPIVPSASGCTPSAVADSLNDVLGTGFNCLDKMVTAAQPPIAVRVSIIARASRRDLNAQDGAAAFARGTLENNYVTATLRPFQPYTTNATTIASYSGTNVAPCTVTNYDHCAGNGNAGGFRRRVLTQVIGLRNIAGMNF